jgi:hypothetical protein
VKRLGSNKACRCSADHIDEHPGLRAISTRDIGGEHTMKKPDTPFARHWLYYIVLKYVLIALAILLTLYVAYQYV